MDPSATYTLSQGEHQYGPFTLEQLREHVNQGSIQSTDLVLCPGMTTWSPVSDVLGSGPTPGVPNAQTPLAPPAPPASVSRSGDGDAYPKPPSLHWVLVLLLTLLTVGIFGLVWMFVHAAWVRRIDPTCKALVVLAVGIPLQLFVGFSGTESDRLFASLVGAVATTWAYFLMRSAIEARFDLELSGPMTFFFNLLYMQYHMTRIAEGEHG